MTPGQLSAVEDWRAKIRQYSNQHHARMNKSSIASISIGLIALLTAGCVGTGPNTQQGAVAGGVIGAIAGAVIGNNTGHGNGGQGALIGAIAGAAIGGTTGNQVDHQRGTIYSSEREATTEIVVDAPPPVPPRSREVFVERTSPDAIWIRGHWEYDGQVYYWVESHWSTPPPHYYHYVEPYWDRRGNRYVYVRGYWRN